MWKNTDDLEALRLGIQYEMKVYNYLKDGEKYCSNREITPLFGALALEKVRRCEYLEKLYSQRSGCRLLYVKMKRSYPLLTPVTDIKTDLELLETILDYERNTKLFYERVASLTQNAKGKSMFDNLAKESKSNIDFLQTEYNIRKKMQNKNTQKILLKLSQQPYFGESSTDVFNMVEKRVGFRGKIKPLSEHKAFPQQ